MENPYSISEATRKAINQFSFVCVFLIFLLLPNCVSAQSQPIGPGKGSFEKDHITGQFLEWDRKATPKLVLRVHGAGMLQTFADISPAGEFKLPLPEVPADKPFGSLNCGDPNKGPIVVAVDVSLLTTLPGFSSPGRWDQGFSVIGMAFYSDEAFSKDIGKPGGKRGHWLYSKVARIVEAGECNNTNSFPIEVGWNAFTVVSGPSGGPHTYKPGFDDDLGWYWSAFPENAAQRNQSPPAQSSDPVENPEQPVAGGSELPAGWLFGEWDGIQMDTRIHMRLQPSGDVWLESIESGRKKSMEGKWSLKDGEFVLDIKEGVLRFNIGQISETSFRLFGKAASSDIVFTRKE